MLRDTVCLGLYKLDRYTILLDKPALTLWPEDCQQCIISTRCKVSIDCTWVPHSTSRNWQQKNVPRSRNVKSKVVSPISVMSPISCALQYQISAFFSRAWDFMQSKWEMVLKVQNTLPPYLTSMLCMTNPLSPALWISMFCVHKTHVNRACQEWTEVHSNGLEINAPESQEVHRYFAFSLLSPVVPVSALTICSVKFTLA